MTALENLIGDARRRRSYNRMVLIIVTTMGAVGVAAGLMR